MERTIKFADIEAAVAKAFDDNKTLKEGTLSPRVPDAKAGLFGISVAFTDGSLINKGDADVPFVLGSLAKVPLSAVLLTQYGPDELLKKSGRGCCCHKEKKPEVPISVHGLRAVSAVEPTGDPEGKWQILLDMFSALTGDVPTLNDAAYKAQLKANAEADVENKIAADGYYLYDTAPIAVDTYSKLQSMEYTTAQVATMGATIAADGRSVVTGVPAFDGALAQYVVGMMAAHGVHKMNKAWMMRVGVPAKSGFGGGVFAIVPGVMAVAAYAPELNEVGVSVKAAKAVAQILTPLNIDVFASAKVKVEK